MFFWSDNFGKTWFPRQMDMSVSSVCVEGATINESSFIRTPVCLWGIKWLMLNVNEVSRKRPGLGLRQWLRRTSVFLLCVFSFFFIPTPKKWLPCFDHLGMSQESFMWSKHSHALCKGGSWTHTESVPWAQACWAAVLGLRPLPWNPRSCAFIPQGQMSGHWPRPAVLLSASTFCLSSQHWSGAGHIASPLQRPLGGFPESDLSQLI